MEKRIYFDNNATTKISKPALEAVLSAYENPLNSSSIHYFGRAAGKICNEAKEEITKLLNSRNYYSIFTSGGTESNNLAIFGLPNYQIITSAIEHSSIYDPAVKKNTTTIIEVLPSGIINMDDLETKIKELGSPNFLVSVMIANNETGAIQPIKEIAKLVHSYGGLIHSDIVQAVGKIEVNLEDLNIDLATISGHKFGGPAGIGALLVRKGIDIEAMIYGGGQEQGKRSGTVNVAGIAGLGEACKIADLRIKQNRNMSILRDYLEKNLQEIGKDAVEIFSDKTPRLPNTSLIATKGISNQIQLIDFDLNGIAVSIGSACSSGSSKPSRILLAMNANNDLIKSSIRISLGVDNTKEEVDQFIKIWHNLYRRINKK